MGRGIVRLVVERELQSALQAMTGRVIYLGPQPERAAGQTLAMVPALARLLDEGIARGDGQLDVAAGVRVPTA
ncbi:MAG: hypothetical protein KIT60_15960 [Burkholderiaceae bacterium]|nr:hypothetical protein [Burkholderiaceae bacterium]